MVYRRRFQTEVGDLVFVFCVLSFLISEEYKKESCYERESELLMILSVYEFSSVCRKSSVLSIFRV